MGKSLVEGILLCFTAVGFFPLSFLSSWHFADSYASGAQAIVAGLHSRRSAILEVSRYPNTERSAHAYLV